MKPIVFCHHFSNLKSILKKQLLITIIASLFICTSCINTQVKVITKVTINSTSYDWERTYSRDYDTFTKTNSVFEILIKDLKAENIPVCLTMITSKKADNSFVLTNSNGVAELTISPYSETKLWISINNAHNQGCSNADEYYRPEYSSHGQDLDSKYDNITISENKSTINVDCKLWLDMKLINARYVIYKLILQMHSYDYAQVNTEIENIIGVKTIIGKQYPKSSELMRKRLLEIFEQTRLEVADDAFQQKEYDSALKIYNDIVENFPNSSSFNKERRDACQDLLQNKIACDSLLTVGNNISGNLTALQFFQSSLANMSPNNDCYNEIQACIDKLKYAIEREKEENEYEQRISKCKAILKKYGVDLSVTQVDIFANPFAYKGKFTALTCIVDKFESPTSAIMKAAQNFYADFQITPPKKVSVLNVIARVKGVKELINAYGAPVKVPYLEIVKILDCSISDLIE